jgi:hypothetical protein
LGEAEAGEQASGGAHGLEDKGERTVVGKGRERYEWDCCMPALCVLFVSRARQGRSRTRALAPPTAEAGRHVRIP